MATKSRISNWAQQLAAATPALEEDQQRIALHIYHLIAATGQPITVAQISEDAGVSAERVEESLRSWPLVLWDDQERVIGFWGIHSEPIKPMHSIGVDGTTVYAWCAWDTLFITELLGRQTRVTSTDPQTGDEIRLDVTPEGVISLDPTGSVVSLLLPEGGLTDDAIQRFCHKVHFFSSPESATAWIDGRPGMFTATVEEAFALGKTTNRLRMGAVINNIDQEFR